MDNARRIGDFDLTIGDVLLVHKNLWTQKHPIFFDYKYGRKVDGFVYCISGSAVYDFGTTRLRLEAGELLFLSADCSYTLQMESAEPFVHITANFSIDRKESLDKSAVAEILAGKRFHAVKRTNAQGFHKRVERLLSIWQSKQYGYRTLARSILYELIYLYMSDVTSAYGDSAEYRRILPAKNYIDAHFIENTSISDLAALCHMSETHMRRLFVRSLDASPTEYRLKLRILTAKDLLLTGTCSVAEIAESVGFDDPNYFSRVFKKETGQSPSAFVRGFCL